MAGAKRWPRAGRSSSKLWWGERSSHNRLAAKDVAAAWVRRADHLDTRAARVGAGAGSGVGKHADEVGRFIAPPASYFDAKDDQAASSVLQQFWIGSFLIPPGILQGCSCVSRDLGSPERVSGDTKVVSTASWFPPHMGNPLAITSMRRSSTLDKFCMLRSASRVFVDCKNLFLCLGMSG